MRYPKRISRVLTPQERARVREAYRLAEAEKEDIIAQGRRHKAAHDRAIVALRQTFSLLKAERESQGLSLSDVEQRTGIGRAALSRLENAQDANPTIATLMRYAEALGKELVVSFQ
jgi:predicted transcriptional regulator